MNHERVSAVGVDPPLWGVFGVWGDFGVFGVFGEAGDFWPSAVASSVFNWKKIKKMINHGELDLYLKTNVILTQKIMYPKKKVNFFLICLPCY